MRESCCFIGHRKIEVTNKLEQKLYAYIENLIVNKNVKIIFIWKQKQV